MNEDIEYKKVEETKYSSTKQLYWNMAIGLQQVDGLTPSSYLKELVTKNIEGKISNYEVEESLHNYYKTKNLNDKKISNERECDLVSTRIVELLNDNSFSFRPIILQNETVNYADYNEIEKVLEYDFKEEIKYDYSKLTLQEQIEHLVIFTSSIWQIHPFEEGNTRTVAVMIEKYLRSLGYKINNDLFKEHSLYFRNALVRSNYSNRVKNIYSTNEYLINFFENLIGGKNHELDNNNNLLV